LLKYNGGDSGIKISVLYWRCSLITVSVIRGFTVTHHDAMDSIHGLRLATSVQYLSATYLPVQVVKLPVSTCSPLALKYCNIHAS
jgi:hypothetical protein